MSLPESLWTAASGHTLAAQTLLREAGENAFNGPLSGSIWLLLGNGLEGLLKTAILVSGGAESELMRPIGHDLRLACARALHLGFVPDVPDLALLAELLDEGHRTHQFRYLVRDTLKLPEPQAVAVRLEALVRQLGPMAVRKPPC